MKFEEKIEILLESIIENIGDSATSHSKMLDLASNDKANLQERIELMLEVVSEVIERQNKENNKSTHSDKQTIRKPQEDFKQLLDRLENVKIKIPQLSDLEHQNELIHKEVSKLAEQIYRLDLKEPVPLAAPYEKSLWWMSGIFFVVIVIESIVLFNSWEGYYRYKNSDEKWRFLSVQDSSGVFDHTNRIWEIDSLRSPRMEWLEQKEKVIRLQEARENIDQELEKYKR